MTPDPSWEFSTVWELLEEFSEKLAETKQFMNAIKNPTEEQKIQLKRQLVLLQIQLSFPIDSLPDDPNTH